VVVAVVFVSADSHGPGILNIGFLESEGESLELVRIRLLHEDTAVRKNGAPLWELPLPTLELVV